VNPIITPEWLHLFLNDLWKDHRRLELAEEDGRQVIRRYGDQQTSIDEEYEFVQRLRRQADFNIPTIFSRGKAYLSFQYIAGTRAFNLMMDLKTLYQRDGNCRCPELALQLVHLLTVDLADFQRIVQKDGMAGVKRKPYPAREKTLNVYRLLLSIQPGGIPFDSIRESLERIVARYDAAAAVSFRDATPKNVILRIPSLFQTHFASYEERLIRLRRMVETGELASLLVRENVFHIDFSGCLFLCPPEDDWIALRHHECADWLNEFEPAALSEADPLQLCVKFVRFSRFGGRKLAYRLLNRNAYRVRFYFDHEVYYFAVMADLCRCLQQQGILRDDRLVNVMQQLIQAAGVLPEIDYVQTMGQQTRRSNYYRDVFPN